MSGGIVLFGLDGQPVIPISEKEWLYLVMEKVPNY
jgi:hypothetical protein